MFPEAVILALHGFAMFNATADEQRRCAEDINRWLAEKKLDVPIGRSFPLSEAAAAHRLLEEAGDREPTRGGIKGSHPIWGGYDPFRYPNWAAKFFVDALLASDLKS